MTTLCIAQNEFFLTKIKILLAQSIFLIKKPHFWFIRHLRLYKHFFGKPSNTLVSQRSTLIGAKKWVQTIIDNKKNIQSVL
jgi:hypothetical protein